MLDPVALLAELIATPSLSGEEDAAAEVVARALRAVGLEPRRFEANVFCERGTPGAPALLFDSHLDTVPVAPGWRRDPYRPEVDPEGRMFGLGATDAKSCVAAMAAAFAAVPEPPAGRRLVFAATAEEEGHARRGNGLERLLPHLGDIAGAVIGEPTGGAICVGQRGLVRAVIVCEGRAGHASRPEEGTNAIEIAAEDVLALRALAREAAESGVDPLLGAPTIQATLIAGGTKANVIPARCEVTLDVRTTRRFDNEAALVRIGAAVRGRVEVKSARYRPLATNPQAPIAAAARRALPAAAVKAFRGVSDLFFVGPRGIILGPGDGAQSHQADEFVRIDAVRAGVDAYARVAREYLA